MVCNDSCVKSLGFGFPRHADASSGARRLELKTRNRIRSLFMFAVSFRMDSDACLELLEPSRDCDSAMAMAIGFVSL